MSGAEYGQAHKDDHVLSLRLSHEEMVFLQDKANAAGCSMSDLVREQIHKMSPVTLFIEGRRVS